MRIAHQHAFADEIEYRLQNLSLMVQVLACSLEVASTLSSRGAAFINPLFKGLVSAAEASRPLASSLRWLLISLSAFSTK